jgi:hypothetical protein
LETSANRSEGLSTTTETILTPNNGCKEYVMLLALCVQIVNLLQCKSIKDQPVLMARSEKGGPLLGIDA